FLQDRSAHCGAGWYHRRRTRVEQRRRHQANHQPTSREKTLSACRTHYAHLYTLRAGPQPWLDPILHDTIIRLQNEAWAWHRTVSRPSPSIRIAWAATAVAARSAIRWSISISARKGIS